MTAQIIDGKTAARELRDRLAEKIAEWQVKPHLAVILVGNDPASLIYDRNKTKSGVGNGDEMRYSSFARNDDRTELSALIRRLNEDREVNGILVQMPLPRHIDSSKIIETIAHEKDVDGFGPYNAGVVA